jgi:hypothetical protein
MVSWQIEPGNGEVRPGVPQTYQVRALNQIQT